LKYAFLVAPIIIIITLKLMGGSFIGHCPGGKSPGSFSRSLLMVDDVVLMNVGLPKTRQKIMDEAWEL
jgi:hypothetical protein